ncbi:MAG: gliding motility-associated C-terminal domain-containing protein [Flammeovirgaceae bacterium]|nr:gliding motility-associated C-terminal domain-containing protein [Flammeovirgaceae bacterium]
MRKETITILFFLHVVVLTHVNAQSYPSRLSRFQVDQIIGCVPFTVTITNSGGCPCDIDFNGDGTFDAVLPPAQPYNQTGTFKLRILYQDQAVDDIVITVLPNPLPEFDVYTCGGNEVQAKVTDTNYDQYNINFNDGFNIWLPSGFATQDHVYGSSGSKSISVRGRYLNGADNCQTSTLFPVDAVAVLPAPTINQLTILDASRIKLDFLNSSNILYRLEIGVNGTNFQQLKQIYNVAADTILNLRPDDNYYCFRLGAFDPCNNTTTYSNTVCSINFDLAIQSMNNALTWQTNSASSPSFAIEKNGGAFFSGLPTSTRSQSDIDVVCKTNYCYRVIADYGTSQSISLEKCGVAFSDEVPSAIIDATASVVATGLDLTWQPDATFVATEFSILRRTGSSSYFSVGSTAAPSFSDVNYTNANNFCYRIDYKDVCDNISSPGTDVCPIRLSGSADNQNTVILNWSAYQGWSAGVASYTIEKYSQDGFLITTVNVGTQTTYTDNATSGDFTNQVYRYKVFATSAGGFGDAYSNEIVVIKEPQLYYPTAFTPDNKGPAQNEVFKVYGQYITSLDMKIFNRWGELLFTTNTLENGWDGTFKGNPQPEGTYAFVANLVDFAGRTFTRSGSIVLIRKR